MTYFSFSLSWWHFVSVRPAPSLDYWLIISVLLCYPTGHPDGVCLHRRVLGPRPGSPSDSPVCGWALRRNGVPGQAVGALWLRGEDPWGNPNGGWEVELNTNSAPTRAAGDLQPMPLGENSSGCINCYGLVTNVWQRSKSWRWNRTGTRDGHMQNTKNIRKSDRLGFHQHALKTQSNHKQTGKLHYKAFFNQILFALYQYMYTSNDIYSLSFYPDSTIQV